MSDSRQEREREEVGERRKERREENKHESKGMDKVNNRKEDGSIFDVVL